MLHPLTPSDLARLLASASQTSPCTMQTHPTDPGTTAITLTAKQLQLLTALLCHQAALLQTKGKETGRTLLFEHVTALAAEADQVALVNSLQAALTKLETAITLEYYRVMFQAMHYTDASLERFQAALKETFPTCERYVCTLWDYNNQPAGKLNDLAFRVYVPASTEPPNVALLMGMVSDFKGIQFDSLSQCWLGAKNIEISDNWTLLP